MSGKDSMGIVTEVFNNIFSYNLTNFTGSRNTSCRNADVR